MKPSGPSSFDDDDGVPGSPPRTQVQLPGAPVREKPITAERSGSMARITKTYPQQEGTVFPRELLEFAIDAAREGYVRTANMGAAFNIMKRQVKDRWTMEKGPSGYVFKEHIHPLESYLRPSVRHEEAHKPAPPAPREKPAVPESESVAEARKRWDAAKTSGDAGAMTRAANDLLRAVEADRAARGESDPKPAKDGRHPTSEVLAPERLQDSSAASGDIARQAGVAAAKAAGAATGEVFMPPSSFERFDHEGESPGLNGRTDETNAPDKIDTAAASRLSDGRLRRVASLIGEQPIQQQANMVHTFRYLNGEEEYGRLTSYLPEHLVENIVGEPDEVRREQRAHDMRSRLIKDVQSPSSDLRAPASLSESERRELSREDRFNPSPSWPWAKPPRNAPYRIVNFLRRMGFDPNRWAEFVNTRDPYDPDRRDWADPTFGWKTNQTALNLLEMGRQGSLTIETLLLLSDAAYWDSSLGNSNDDSRWMPDQFEDIPSFFDADSGWERIYAIDDPRTGMRTFALYNRRMRTVFVVNRGTRTDPRGFATDASTDGQIFSGRVPMAFDQAHDFMHVVWRKMKERGLQDEQVVLTGHSLGGALAQLQLAVSHRDTALVGMKTFAVTFAALGAQEAVLNHLARRGMRSVPEDVQQFAQSRLLNFVRAGDGYPYRSAVFGERSAGLGTTEELGGLYMQEIRALERKIGPNSQRTLEYLKKFQQEPLDATAHFLKLLATERDDHARLAILYVLNHSLRSYYRPEFSESFGQAVRRTMSRRRQAPPSFLR